MASVIFDDTIRVYTSNAEVFTVGPGTVSSTLTCVLSEFPQLFVKLMENDGEFSKRIAIILNDEILLEANDRELLLTDSDTIFISEVIPAGESGTATAVSNQFVSWGTNAIVANLLGVLAALTLQVAVNLALYYILGALTEKVKTPEDVIAAGSSTYTFDGVTNTTPSGTPLGLIYGKHRIGGQILNLFTENPSPATTDLYYLVGLSEGVIESVDNIELGKLPITYYNGVSNIEKRLGTKDQSIIPDFSRSVRTVNFSREIMNTAAPLPVATMTELNVTTVYGVIHNGGVLLGDYTWK